MNILIVSAFPIPHGGGLSSHVEDLIRALQDNGHIASLIEGKATNLHRNVLLFHRLISGGLNDSYRCWYEKAKIKRIAKCVEQFLCDNTVDLIHCHDPSAGYAVHEALSKMKLKVPVLETIHGPKTYEAEMTIGGNIKKFLSLCWDIESQAFFKADHLIAVDSGQAAIAVDDFGVDKSKITVMFNSVSCESIETITKEPASIEVSKPYLLVPRRLVAKNGVQTAIKALVELDPDINVNLVIAGDGPLRSELEKLATSLGVDSQVTFLGSIQRQEVLRLVNEALAVIIPSIPSSKVVEATSIAVIEAMACGVVAIASNIGGLAELIQNNETGFLVPHSDARELGNVISSLVGDPDLRNNIACQGRQYVLQNLDLPIWFSKVFRVYNDMQGTSIEA
jgi:glycosyltransferase involved in cell wall biosynthesis